MPLSPSLLSHQLLGLPWQFLVLGLALCLIFSALGFKRVEYFVSLGYAASVAAQGDCFPDPLPRHNQGSCLAPVRSAPCVWFEAWHISRPS